MRRCQSCQRITGDGPICAHCQTPLDASIGVTPTMRTYAVRALGIVTVAAIVVSLLANMLASLFPLLGKSLAGSDDTVDAAYTTYSALLIVAIIAWLPAAVLFIVWLWRARKNLDSLPVHGQLLGAGWAIGGWFVPLANLVIPCRVVYQVAANSVGRWWIGPVVGFWWAALILDNFVNRQGSDAPASLDLTDHVAWFEQEVVVGVISTGLLFVAAACITAIILTVSRKQEEAIDAAKHQASQAALAALLASQGGGDDNVPRAGDERGERGVA